MSSKKIIHALTIIDKSGSMERFRSRTIEGVNENISVLKKEIDENTEILNTQLQFSGEGNNWISNGVVNGRSFVFKHTGKSVAELKDMTPDDYVPSGGTPLLDAIGYGIEKVKEFHGDKLGDENLKIIVTVFTDGEENESRKWTKDEIRKMVEHFQSDGKWTFTFVGCGSLDNVTATSAGLGVAAANTVAYSYSDEGTRMAYRSVATSYRNFARSTKLGVVDNSLFTEKSEPTK